MRYHCYAEEISVLYDFDRYKSVEKKPLRDKFDDIRNFLFSMSLIEKQALN